MYSGVGLKGEHVHYAELCRMSFIHFLIVQKLRYAGGGLIYGKEVVNGKEEVA